MARRDLFPILNCTDLARTRSFYEHVFGGEVTYRFPDEGEAVYVVLAIGDGQIGLGGGTGPAMYGEVPRPSTGHAVDVCLYVDNLATTLERAATAGVRVPMPATDTPWGETVAYVEDPEGTMLLVIQAEEEQGA